MDRVSTKILTATNIVQPTSWIWSDWLIEQNTPRIYYERFTHYEFVENSAMRPIVEEKLAKLLHDYHTYSPTNTNLLTQLRYPRLAAALISDQRPKDKNTSLGNFNEILACEFAKKEGYDIPIMRLRYNPNPEQSMKGDDILGFAFSTSQNELDVVLVGEGKFRSTFKTEAVKEAYEGLLIKSDSYSLSMEFNATILFHLGENAKAAKIRQMQKKIKAHSKYIDRKCLLFLGTVGQPQNPFESLEQFKGDLLPNLIAVNIVFRDGLQNWLSQVYAKEVAQ